MKIIKCIKKVVAMAMLGAMVITTPVMAKTNDVHLNSSLDVNSIQDLMSCQVYDYEVDSLYEDRAIRAYAKSYLEEGFIVFDEKRLVDNLGVGLEYSDDYLFYNGIRVTDTYLNPSKEIYICKCNQNEFNEYVKLLPNNYKKSSDICYDCYWNNGDYSSVIYDSVYEIITVSYYSSVG
ncbi:MAG: hypothetical protein J5684_01940 [Eubacterium sp.]|nr:hypothetical protein [Eubacterium sp.]